MNAEYDIIMLIVYSYIVFSFDRLFIYLHDAFSLFFPSPPLLFHVCCFSPQTRNHMEWNNNKTKNSVCCLFCPSITLVMPFVWSFLPDCRACSVRSCGFVPDGYHSHLTRRLSPGRWCRQGKDYILFFLVDFCFVPPSLFLVCYSYFILFHFICLFFYYWSATLPFSCLHEMAAWSWVCLF